MCVTKNIKRVAQLGEATKNIFNYGSLSSEEIKKFKFEKRSNLIKKFKIPYFKNNILATFHPETRSKVSSKRQIEIFKIY